ncbi:MAG: DUF4430 domain-containing protein [Thermoleophilia bacterium]|nr:DUF4430 domain-containing protein [Thermoleophilia bacterium]
MPRAVLALALAVAALVLAACGGEGGAVAAGEGATLWVTRDRGAAVLVNERVPARGTVLQALKRAARVKTRYGGRFVQAVNGLEGSLEGQHDWFYFVNGIEPDVGSAEVRVRAGDVVWWDFRSWRGRMAQPIVVGAFPEPFLHGWSGRRRPAQVRAPRGFEGEAKALLATLGGGEGEGEADLFVLELRPGAHGAALTARRGAQNGSPVTFTLAGSREAVRAAARTLVQDPAAVRFRYQARFDERGEIVP